MHTNRSLFGIARLGAAFIFLAMGSASLMQAQQSPSVPLTPKAPLFLASEIAPADHTSASEGSYSSSSSSDAVAEERFNLSSAALDSSQPPPRRRYGRPNYSDSHTNPDGSSKFSFVGGVGFNVPTGGSHNYLTPGWRFQVGVGRNFNKTLGVLAQFDYDHFGFQTATLNTLLATYNRPPISAGFTQLGGTSHDWSFSLDPIINYYNGDTWGAYATGGAGFYHKTANFTVPGTGTYCDPYYGCYQYQANQTVDKYTSNAFGLNGGFGFTYKPSSFSGERLFAEARYVWTDNSPRPYSLGSTSNSYFNAFPQNSARTTYIPITFGIRF